MKHLFLSILTLFTIHANAEGIKLDNVGQWQVRELKARSEFLGNAEMTMTLPQEDHGFSPTILVEKLPLVAVLETKEEWHHLIFLNKAKDAKIVIMNEKVIKVGDNVRYFVQFQAHTGADSVHNAILMATSINGEIYSFIFQNHPQTFRAFAPAVKDVLKTMAISPK